MIKFRNIFRRSKERLNPNILEQAYNHYKETVFRKGTKDEYTDITKHVGYTPVSFGLTLNDKAYRILPNMPHLYIMVYETDGGKMKIPHKHMNAESGMILEGAATYSNPHEKHVIGPADTFNIPAHVWHHFEFHGPTKIVLFYHPPFTGPWKSVE